MLTRLMLNGFLMASMLFAVLPSAAQESSASTVDEIQKLEAQSAQIDQHAADEVGDKKDMVAAFVQRYRGVVQFGEQLDAFMEDASALNDAEVKKRFLALLQGQFDTIDAGIKETFKRMDAVRSERSTAAEANQLEYEYPLRDYDELLSDLLQEQLSNLERATTLGVEVAQRMDALDKLLVERAGRQADRMEITRQRIESARALIKSVPEDQRATTEAELVALEERRQRIKLGLGATIDLLRQRGQDVSEYVQVLIRTTGEISGDILDSKVMLGLLDDWLIVIRTSITENGPRWVFKLLIVVIIIGIFKLLAGIAGRVVRRTVSNSKMEFSSLLQEFFVKLAANLVLFIGIVIAMSQLGIEVGPLLAGFGVAGLIIGFALQDTLSNFASGMMILIYRPFDINDVVEAGGVSGKVSQMSLVSTTILTFDNQKLVVPNNKIWGDVIRNVNAAPTRRVDLTFGIGYDDDIAEAESVLQAIVTDHELVLQDPAPTIKLHNLGESSVDFIVRPWVKAADYWQVYWDVTRAVKERFDAAGISIPYPQRDLHLYREHEA